MAHLLRLIRRCIFALLALPALAFALIQPQALFQYKEGSSVLVGPASLGEVCTGIAGLMESRQSSSGPQCSYGTVYCTFTGTPDGASACVVQRQPGGYTDYIGVEAFGSSCPPGSASNGSGMCACNAGYLQVGNTCELSNPDKTACWNLSVQGTLPGGVLTQDYRFQGNVEHGQQLCLENPGGGMSSPSKGCKVTFKRVARLDYGGGNLISEGTISMASDSNTVDQSCTIGPNESPKPAPKPEKCPNGYTGTVNGVEVCINKVPDAGVGGNESDSTEENNGTETRRVNRDSRTECNNGSCTTTITTTTTVTNNSSGASTTTTSTSTSTKPQAGFCQENPRSKLCSDGDEKGSSFGGSCAGGFTCEGDAIQCAMAQEQHRRACKLFDDKSPESELYEAEKKKDRNRDVTKDLPGNEEVDVSGRLSRLNVLGAAACIGDLSVTVWHTEVTLPFSRLCTALEQLGWILVVVSSIAAARIITKT